jgi:glutamate racemase
MKNRILLLLIASLFCASCSFKGRNSKESESIPVVNKSISDPSSIYFADYKHYPRNRKSLPIGVFDSGTGGLTVLEAFLKMDLFNNATKEEGSDGIPDFQGEDFIYLADQANMPYGIYSSQGKQDYLRELVVKDALFLTKKPNLSKIVVIACNTATAYGLKDVENLLEQSKTGLSVVGVINAGANASLDMLSNNKDGSAIGVMATVGTIASGGYENTILKIAQQRGFSNQIRVVNQAGHGFAEAVDMEPDFIDRTASTVRDNYRGPTIGTDSLSIKLDLLDRYNFDFSKGGVLFEKEGGLIKNMQLNSSGNYARFHLVSLIEKHRANNNGCKLKNIILGCTHYPFLIDTLMEVVKELRSYQENGIKIYDQILSDDLVFIDPAIYTAKEVYTILTKTNIFNIRSQSTSLEAFISTPARSLKPENLDKNGNLSFNFKYGRDIDSEIQTVEVVPFSKSNINPYNLQRIKERLPLSYQLIHKIIE